MDPRRRSTFMHFKDYPNGMAISLHIQTPTAAWSDSDLGGIEYVRRGDWAAAPSSGQDCGGVGDLTTSHSADNQLRRHLKASISMIQSGECRRKSGERHEARQAARRRHAGVASISKGEATGRHYSKPPRRV